MIILRKLIIVSIILLLSACSPVNKTDTLLTEVEENVFELLDVETAYETVEEMSQTPRIAGMESEKKAASYITEKLATYDYEVEEQVFQVENYTFPTVTEIIVDGFNQQLFPAPFEFSIPGHVEAPIIYANEGELADYEQIDATGKIVLVKVNELIASDIVKQANEAGASGVIMYVKADMDAEGWSLDSPEHSLLPALALSYEEGIHLHQFIEKKKTVTGELIIEDAQNESKTSQNLIVTKLPATESSDHDLIIVGAHYDSITDSPGASDNASGTAVLLEIAKAIKVIPNDKEIQLVFFGAEEIGMLGSKNFVDEMNDNDIERTIAMFNMDMVGSADAGNLAIFTVDGNKNTATETISRARNALFDDQLLVDETDRSDHAAFYYAEIDAVLISYFPLEEWYHSPQDTIEKISKTKLLEAAQVVSKAVLELSMTTAQDD